MFPPEFAFKLFYILYNFQTHSDSVLLFLYAEYNVYITKRWRTMNILFMQQRSM